MATLVALAFTCAFAALNHTFNGIFLFVALIKSVDLIGDIWLAPAQSAGRTRSLGFYQFINGLASLILFSGGIYFGMPGVYALAMSLLGSVIAAAFALIVGSKSISSAPEIEGFDQKPPMLQAFQLAITAAPLGLAGFLNSATQAAPGYFLERADGLESVGILSAMVYLLLAGNTVVGAVVQFELPRSVSQYQKHGREVLLKRTRSLTWKMCILSVISIVAALLFGETVMRLLYGPEYGVQSVLVLLAISWAVGAVSWMWDLALVVQRSFNVQLVAASIGLASSALASIILIGPFGLFGAGMATLIARIAVALVRIIGLTFYTGYVPKHRLKPRYGLGTR
ncbi:hypothetical protein WG915_11095 [Corynebacterium sp. H128]|uniref:lipopolysaccharide biosynthesis protein n=1 Tax=Corynebacterium sp. H128 TaxID=3133427 RepID=UPI0030AA7155